MAANSRSQLTKAVKVGRARTGSFGKRVAGTAGRTASGGRGGMTDQGIAAGSRAYGRSAPGTGIGGAGGKTTGSVVETTTGAGGVTRTPPPSPPRSPLGGTVTSPGTAQAPMMAAESRSIAPQPTTRTMQSQPKAAAKPRSKPKPKPVAKKAPAKKKPVVAHKGPSKNRASKPGMTSRRSTSGGGARDTARRAVAGRKTGAPKTAPKTRTTTSTQRTYRAS